MRYLILLILLLFIASCGGGGGFEVESPDYFSIGDDVCIKLVDDPGIVSDFRLGPPVFYEVLHLDEYNVAINTWFYWYELSPIEECSGQRVIPDELGE